MKVKVIMIPVEKIACISMKHTIKKAMEIIDTHQLLSLPVLEGERFVGVLSKQHTYESFFKEYEGTREMFLQETVSSLMKTKIDTIQKDARIEEAAAMFISSKVRFIPVTNEEGILLGIVTQQAVFKEYQKMFGNKYNSLVIYTYNNQGALAKVTEAVAKAGGNIRNLLMIYPEMMDIIEIFIRIESEDFDKVVKVLRKNGLDVRDIKYAEN